MIKKHYATLTAENSMKPSSILRADGVYNYAQADSIVAFARQNGLKMRGHTLVWHNQTPFWFFFDEKREAIDSTALYKRLEGYMREVMTHFKEAVFCWDVVNEALSDAPGEFYRTNSPWYRACGEVYIEKAFRLAHSINPNVKLFYNDYNLIQPEKREKAYQLVKRLKEAGVPIHGIGMQAHWSLDETREAIETAINRFASLGVEVHITELDLTVYPSYHGEGARNQPKEIIEWTPELAKRQAEAYKMIFDVFRANHDKITSVTFWGLADNYTWLHDYPVRGRRDYPFVFDHTLTPKDSYREIVEF
jgi:endo-1,4-beta-xylanase